ncbi:hypothetical protein HY346_02105 [Candidatus Microgenomates bacterium]|nr:hypothetical protein [Candidatus Microgenomates bacterium]
MVDPNDTVPTNPQLGLDFELCPESAEALTVEIDTLLDDWGKAEANAREHVAMARTRTDVELARLKKDDFDRLLSIYTSVANFVNELLEFEIADDPERETARQELEQAISADPSVAELQNQLFDAHGSVRPQYQNDIYWARRMLLLRARAVCMLAMADHSGKVPETPTESTALAAAAQVG